jgi:peptidoglycan/LPS O-acetylase OafA/YrhL
MSSVVASHSSPVGFKKPNAQTEQPLSFKPSPGYIPYLDGLRAVSILMVMAAHFGFGNIIPAGFGVTIFFFISGFLITRLLFVEKEKSPLNKISIPEFYVRRSFRIFPALAFSILAVVTVYISLGVKIPPIELFAAFFFFQNYLINALHAAGHLPVLPLNSLWSLAVEEHFYIFWPFLFSIFSKNVKTFAKLVGLALFVCLAWRVIWIYVLHNAPLYCYYATDTRADSILYGSMMSILCMQPNLGHKILKATSNWLYIGLAILVSSFVIKDEAMRQSFRYTLQGIGLFLVFSGLLFSNKHKILKSVLEHPVSRFVGRISYSLYLWHFALFHIFEKTLAINHTQLVLLSTVVSFALATFSYYCVETPLINFRKTLSKKKKPVPESSSPVVTIQAAEVPKETASSIH